MENSFGRKFFVPTNVPSNDLFDDFFYRIAKNSFGAKWGEKGYIRIARGTGICRFGGYFGLATIATN